MALVRIVAVLIAIPGRPFLQPRQAKHPQPDDEIVTDMFDPIQRAPMAQLVEFGELGGLPATSVVMPDGSIQTGNRHGLPRSDRPADRDDGGKSR